MRGNRRSFRFRITAALAALALWLVVLAMPVFGNPVGDSEVSAVDCVSGGGYVQSWVEPDGAWVSNCVKGDHDGSLVELTGA